MKESNMTLGELAKALNEFITIHPEFSDYEVSHASECGYSDAGFLKPLTIAVPIYSKEFLERFGDKDSKYVWIVSDDDGFRTDWAILEWKFYELGGDLTFR